jgi:hypothetical protein
MKKMTAGKLHSIASRVRNAERYHASHGKSGIQQCQPVAVRPGSV